MAIDLERPLFAEFCSDCISDSEESESYGIGQDFYVERLVLELEFGPGLSILHKSMHVNMFWRHMSPVSFMISGPTALHIPAMVEGHREDIGSNHFALRCETGAESPTHSHIVS